MASNIITSRSFPLTSTAKEIDKVYRRVLASVPAEYSQVLKVENAMPGSDFYQAEHAGLNMLPGPLSEGGSVLYASTIEGNPLRRDYDQFGLGYVITELMIKDERHGVMKKLPADLAKAMAVYIEIRSMELYNTAETKGMATVKDGRALCDSRGHALLNDQLGVGTQYNIASTPGDLSETTFKEATEYFRGMVDENGFPVQMTLDKLLVSWKDQDIAHRLHTQQYGSTIALGGLGTGTASNDSAQLNLANPSNNFVNGYSIHSLRYLDDDRWFALSNDHDNKLFWKDQPKQTSKVDFDTDNVKYKSKMRFGVWAYEYAGTFGNITGNTRT